MKKIKMLLCYLLTGLSSFACPVCERNQPKVLKGIIHGAGPESQWDYVIVWTTVAIVLLTLVFTIKWIVRPGEKSDTHIKRAILNNQ